MRWGFGLLLMALVISGCGQNHPYKPDPLEKDQWYIDGSAQGYIDINLHHNLFNDWFKGSGVLVAIVDNGIDIYHEDLKANIGEGSYSYLPEGYRFTDADHGTCCAGIIAAVEGNGKGIRGIAPEAKIIGYNALKAPSISNIADALVRHKERVWISSNSWGDFNSWGEPFRLRKLEEDALHDGVTHGRGGKGIVYVFAAGNGSSESNATPTDNINYSGLVNNRYTLPIGAVDEHGKKAYYSEEGASLLIVAPSKAKHDGPGIVTTDATGEEGYNPKTFSDDYDDHNYTKNFSGTSASTPIVSGVVALMLEANPHLGWRDVRIILAQSARKNDPDDDDWTTNGAGLHINHKYGFGLIDANKAISLALNWVNVSEELYAEGEQTLNKPIPDNDTTGITGTITIEKDMVIEYVYVTFDAPDHDSLGDLEVTLISPDETQSILAVKHNETFGGYFRYKLWRFGSVRHLGEHALGTWKLIVRDLAEGSAGTFKSWKLEIFGHQKKR